MWGTSFWSHWINNVCKQAKLKRENMSEMMHQQSVGTYWRNTLFGLKQKKNSSVVYQEALNCMWVESLLWFLFWLLALFVVNESLKRFVSIKLLVSLPSKGKMARRWSFKELRKWLEVFVPWEEQLPCSNSKRALWGVNKLEELLVVLWSENVIR